MSPQKPLRKVDTAAIVLLGGRSSRMGSDKASLDFHGETLAARVVKRALVATARVVAVASIDQDLLQLRLPNEVAVVRDAAPFEGPLFGFATGLAALPPETTAVALLSVDLPHLEPTILTRMFERLEDRDAVVPDVEGRLHPLVAVYATRGGALRDTIASLLARGERAMTKLLRGLAVRYSTASEFTDLDPRLASFFNVNTPSDYARALAPFPADARRANEDR